MAVIENTYTGDGSTVLFSFTFPYLSDSDVKVSLDGTDTTAYSLANATQVQLTTAPASGVAVRVYRSTSDTALSAEFFPGAAVKSSDLNNNFNQTLYITQESNSIVSDALTKANSASAAVEGAFFYTPVADVSAIPGSPSDNDRIEIIDSTNVESTSGVNASSLPSGFTGSSALSVRLEYSSGAWQFKQYFATDPEARYYSKASGTSNASSIATNTSNISTNTANISTNASDISTNTSNISTNASNISTNASAIAANTSDISTNTSNISTNASNISTNTSNISTNTSNISTNTSNISSNTSNISTNTTNIASKMPKAGGTFTGDVYFEDELIVKGDSTNAGKITLNCENNIHGIKIKGPPHSASANYTLTLPTGTGNNGNSLITDGSGGLSWGSPTADVSNKADVDSPTFTGTPAAPTATQGTSTTQIATTAFVNAEIAADTVNLAPKASPTFTGIPAAPTASAGTNTTQVATTQFVATAVSSKAPLLSPSLTGTPTAPTATSGTNTTQIATTAFVDSAVSPKAPLASPSLTGTPTAPTAAVDTNTTQIATTEFVQTQIANDATPLNSPAFTGTPTAPTATQGTNTTQIATTAFVNAEISADTANLAPLASPTFTGTPTAPTAASGTNTTQLATTAFVDDALASKANLASPTLTGTPAAPTAAQGTNTTQIATTAFVNSEIAADIADKAPLASPQFTGIPVAKGDGSTTDGQIQLNCSQNTHGVKIKSPPHSAGASYTLTLPNDTGSANEFLKTDGSGTLSWAGAAPTASPTFTGTPTAPTAATGTNTTQIATTQYVQGEIGNSIQAYDADIVKRDVATTFTAKQTLDDVHVAGVHTSVVTTTTGDIATTSGNYFEREITSGSVTSIAFTGTPASSGQMYSFTLRLKLNGGTVASGAWPTAVKWAGGSEPTLAASKNHILFFFTPDQGTTYYGSALTDFDL